MARRTRRWRNFSDALITTLLSIVVAGLALAVCGVLFLFASPSYHAYAILGKSMQPAVNLGDVVIVGPPGGFLSHSLAPGDVVTFQSPAGLVTHRIVSIDGQNLVTRGDAVGHNDPQAVALSQVKGVVIARLPQAGIIPRLLRSGHSYPLLALIPACICLLLVRARFKGARRSLGKRRSALRAPAAG